MVLFRGFISVDIAEIGEFGKIDRELRTVGGGMRPVAMDIIHITLKFLGETDEAAIPKIISAMEKAAKGVAPFEMTLKGMGSFPSRDNIRVVWVGMQGAEPLISIAKILEDECARLGFEKEDRPFSPHLTVGRMKDPRGTEQVKAIIEQFKDHDFGRRPVRSIRLKKSVLSPKGPTYTTVAEVVLQAP
ncbi:MAG: RNA 2',3'-cyclic phosphodiesterase [Methanomassiliicoccales archaeon]|jgi:2'-5' RNA ligase